MKRRTIGWALVALAFVGCGGGTRAILPAMSPGARLPKTAKIVVKPSSLTIHPGAKAKATVSESGYTGKFTETSSCKGIAAAKPVTGKGPKFKLTVTAVRTGSCAITLHDASKNKRVLSVKVVNSSPSSFAIATPLPSGNAGSEFSSPEALTILVKDSSGNTETGDYSEPVTVTDSDTTNATGLSLNGAAVAKSVNLTKSTDSVGLTYSGLAIAPVTISVGATGAATTTASFAPVLTVPNYTCNGGASGDTSECDPTIPQQIDLYATSGTGSAGSFTLSQTGWTELAYGGTFSESDTCGGMAAISTSNHLKFTATAANGASSGTCTVTLTGGGGESLKVTVTYSSTGVTVF